MKGVPQKILGFDNRGEVYHGGDAVLRRVSPEHRQRAVDIFGLYERHALNAISIVETRLDEAGEYLFRHKKLLTTHPAEWAAGMLKEAALFHLKLLQTLPSFGLTLKDALPNNVLFDAGAPCFVDFLSLVRIEDLQREEWLVRYAMKNEDLRTTVLRNMFVPALLTPLVAMSVGKYDLAREMLSRQACHPNWIPPRAQQIAAQRMGPRRLWKFARYRIVAAAARKLPPEKAYAALERFVAALDVTPRGGYSSYYASKKEDFPLDEQSQWKPKQRSVHQVLSRLRPRSVLDLGANTGWFSRLAERLGAEVVSVDVDEPSLERLYQAAKKDRLRITPLKVSFGDLERPITMASRKQEEALSLCFPAPVQRLRCDVVMMLGLIHHLVLGEGRTFESVLSVLKELSSNAALVEFVSIDDPLIAGNPGFFRNLSAMRGGYSMENFLAAATRRFQRHEIFPSHPDTRQLVLLE